MKESSEDIIMKNIKEVLEQYEPDYSPQFWEKIRKQRPVPELRLKTLLLNYRFWLSILTIAGVLFIIYRVTDFLPADKNSAVDPLSPESLNYSVSEKAKEITNSEKTSVSGNSVSYNSIGREERNISSQVTPARITDPLPAAYKDYIPAEYEIAERPERIEKDSGINVLLDVTDFGFQFKTPQLIITKSKAAEIPVLKSPSLYKTRKLEFNWPDFNSPEKKEGYDKFVGPNKLAFFYSPEIHYNGSLGAVGVSQGIGISLEGPIRSLVSISAGLSYQETNIHNKIIFSGKVPPHDLVLQPADTNRTFYYNDSTVFNSGSYKFLELPVSVSYKFIESARSQVWLGAGISAIAFLRQNYTYETVVEEISESSGISVKAWENIHPLASFNLGLLYRYKFNDRLFLQLSAQYKQHLVPLGYNSMKLNRLNFQVGIIYRFGRED